MSTINTGDDNGKYVTFKGSLLGGSGEEISLSIPISTYQQSKTMRMLGKKMVEDFGYEIESMNLLNVALHKLDAFEITFSESDSSLCVFDDKYRQVINGEVTYEYESKGDLLSAFSDYVNSAPYIVQSDIGPQEMCKECGEMIVLGHCICC